MQAEIDAAAELADFFRFNAYFAKVSFKLIKIFKRLLYAFSFSG